MDMRAPNQVIAGTTAPNMPSSNGTTITVNIDINDARPASEACSPSACMRYPRLTQKPNSMPAFLVLESFHPRNKDGMKGMAARLKRTNVKAAGSIIARTSLTTGMLLA
uniref:Uncharacterized protein n=1 Tax=Lotus japonicus TaxID=34305 RepID=I3SR33_LOTJA|nr:unknown [Lotus japonicus]